MLEAAEVELVDAEGVDAVIRFVSKNNLRFERQYLTVCEMAD